MALQAALDFITHCRQSIDNDPLNCPYREAGSLAELSQQAARSGFIFNLDELRHAHRLDWQLRMMKAVQSRP